MTPEQRAAFFKFADDMRKIRPQLEESAVVAQRIWQEMSTARGWQIHQPPKPEGVDDSGVWTVGHAKINYVDHIEGEPQ